MYVLKVCEKCLDKLFLLAACNIMKINQIVSDCEGFKGDIAEI